MNRLLKIIKLRYRTIKIGGISRKFYLIYIPSLPYVPRLPPTITPLNLSSIIDLYVTRPILDKIATYTNKKARIKRALDPNKDID